MAATVPALPEPGLYVGEVMHQRLRPLRHRFVYRVFSLLVDLDRLGALDRRLRLLSVDRANLLSLQMRDHGARDGSPLRPWVEAQLCAHGLGAAAARIFLLCYPRVLGYVFNPISVYFCYAASGRLAAIVYEVKNTFGGQHPYVLPVAPGRGARGAIRQTCTKDLYVSPFIAMAARYRFRLSPPGERLALVIQEDDAGREAEAGGPLMVATLTARRRPLTDRELLRAMIRQPFMTQKVIAGIHFEAIRLWLKGARTYPRPSPDGTRSCPPGPEEDERLNQQAHAKG